VYVRQQKAAEEQLRFDKTEKPSHVLPPKITEAVYHCARPSAVGVDVVLSKPDGMISLMKAVDALLSPDQPAG
jgi:hypothetical protein